MLRIREFLTLGRAKRSWINIMLISNVLFILNVTYSDLSHSLVDYDAFRSWLVIKVAILYGFFYLIFYKGVDLILRYFFHSRLRDKIRAKREDFLRNKNNNDVRDLVFVTNDISRLVYNYFVKMGLLPTSIYEEPTFLLEKEKEDVFNFVLKDMYSWIALIIHTSVTAIFVFKFYAIWFMVILILALVFMLFAVITVVYLLMHWDVVEAVRKRLLRISGELM